MAAQGQALVRYNIAHLRSIVCKNPKIAAKWRASRGVFVALQWIRLSRFCGSTWKIGIWEGGGGRIEWKGLSENVVGYPFSPSRPPESISHTLPEEVGWQLLVWGAFSWWHSECLRLESVEELRWMIGRRRKGLTKFSSSSDIVCSITMRRMSGLLYDTASRRAITSKASAAHHCNSWRFCNCICWHSLGDVEANRRSCGQQEIGGGAMWGPTAGGPRFNYGVQLGRRLWQRCDDDFEKW